MYKQLVIAGKSIYNKKERGVDMRDFIFHNPTKIYFGKNALQYLADEMPNYGKTILFMYGKQAIKKIGLYDEVLSMLQQADKTVIELSGIQPNPTYEQLCKGAQLVKEHAVDLILAVGGGSVIDCAKAISVSAYCKEDPWQKYWVDRKLVDNRIVPVGTILTMTGTGSEMNGGSVITNETVERKSGRGFSSEVHPKFSILDPTYTMQLPHYQMVSGIFDIVSHLLEQYFSGTDDNTTDYLIEGVLESLIHSSKIAVKDPQNYEARSNIMWCATMALNRITGLGKEQDWQVHSIEHQISAYTDCAHGMGLAAISIPYYRYIYKAGLDKFVRFAMKIWQVNPTGKTKDQIALEGIDCLANFIRECKMATTLQELGVTHEMLPKIASSCDKGGGYRDLTTKEVLQILESCYE